MSTADQYQAAAEEIVTKFAAEDWIDEDTPDRTGYHFGIGVAAVDAILRRHFPPVEGQTLRDTLLEIAEFAARTKAHAQGQPHLALIGIESMARQAITAELSEKPGGER